MFLTDEGYTLDRFYNNAKTVTIPSTYKELPVTKIYLDAFFNCTSMEEIFISSNESKPENRDEDWNQYVNEVVRGYKGDAK